MPAVALWKDSTAAFEPQFYNKLQCSFVAIFLFSPWVYDGLIKNQASKQAVDDKRSTNAQPPGI